jgi:hypothetical protein
MVETMFGYEFGTHRFKDWIVDINSHDAFRGLQLLVGRGAVQGGCKVLQHTPASFVVNVSVWIVLTRHGQINEAIRVELFLELFFIVPRKSSF